MEPPRPPKRRFSGQITVHADTMEDLEHALKEISFDIVDRGSMGPCHSGGCDSGWSYEIREDPSMTPERYKAELDRYLDRVRKEGS